MLKVVCMEHNHFELAFDDHNALMHKKRLLLRPISNTAHFTCQ